MKLYDGRESFYQWDTNQKLTGDGIVVGDILHFFNSKQSSALTLVAYEFNGVAVVDVPNILLQSSYPVLVYRWVDDEVSTRTLKKYEFKVEQRPRPSDYVYTETEVLSYATLNQRISELEQGGVGGVDSEEITEVIRQYLEDNPPEPGPQGPKGDPGVGISSCSIDNGILSYMDSQGGIFEIGRVVGNDGQDGQDGITPHIGDNGNWYLGDTDTGKSSRGVDGQDGAPGTPGNNGADGYTPVKGVDYYTEAEKQEIIQEVSQNIIDPLEVMIDESGVF